jgi:hypothetical protein
MGLFRRGKGVGQEPEPDALTDDESVVLEEARRLVLPGFTPLEEARSAIVEMVEDDEDLDVTPARAVAMVEGVWAARVAEQTSWHGLSDADRVEAAFGELAAAGIVARMCFTCCQSCGSAEIGDEVAEGTDPRGFAFFHQQDADRLAEPAALLYLSYGAFLDSDHTREEFERASVEVGHVVKHALEANGLRVDWDGTLRQRIGVRDLDWRRRLPS